WPSPIHCIYSQRMLDCIPYPDALNFLRMLKARMAPQAQAFLSAGGLETEYGNSYPDRDKPLEKRFTRLTPDMAQKHDIHAEVCLYHEKDLCQLAEKAGLKIIRSWTSAFGNPKLIAQA
ncbi:MAG: hypothetical protein SFW62_08870, partial [Alphaproteobacteria bacterium]|nr:hypothetical protein [Alphaproteobacteria bacterium]